MAFDDDHFPLRAFTFEDNDTLEFGVIAETLEDSKYYVCMWAPPLYSHSRRRKYRGIDYRFTDYDEAHAGFMDAIQSFDDIKDVDDISEKACNNIVVF